MKPYEYRRLIANPDPSDIRSEGRASHVGRLIEQGGDYKSYSKRPTKRAETRRSLKRADKAKAKRDWMEWIDD